MEVKPDEIAAILERELAGYEADIDIAEVGTVLNVGDGIARVYGLDNALAGELLSFPNEVYGLALNLEEHQVGAVLMGESRLGLYLCIYPIVIIIIAIRTFNS